MIYQSNNAFKYPWNYTVRTPHTSCLPPRSVCYLEADWTLGSKDWSILPTHCFRPTHALTQVPIFRPRVGYFLKIPYQKYLPHKYLYSWRGWLIIRIYFKLAFLKSFLFENYKVIDQNGSLESSHGIEKWKCNKSGLRC